jgi:glucosamine--fructose-6-phosphate aminotransferase (isomerizing)
MGLGVAQEAALKFKETSGIHAEAFSAAEVRHGPIALIGADFPLLVFRQPDETEDSIDSLVGEVTARGSAVLVAGVAPAGATSLPTVAADSVLAPILQIQSFYRAINALALARGCDPDNPPHLRKVTRTV